jgi:hypothetical protein
LRDRRENGLGHCGMKRERVWEVFSFVKCVIYPCFLSFVNV